MVLWEYKRIVFIGRFTVEKCLKINDFRRCKMEFTYENRKEIENQYIHCLLYTSDAADDLS